MNEGYRYGDGNDFECIPPADQTISGTTPIVTKVIDIRDLDSVSFQLISADLVTVVPVTSGDEAVAVDDELDFAAFDFTGMNGAVITISGSQDNDGDFTITAGADGSAVVTPTPTDELFDPDAVTVTVTQVQDPAQGAWTFEVSNNYQPEGIASYGQVPTTGEWSSVTALFAPGAVTTPGSQFKQANLRARSLRATFTPSDGQGTVRANVNGKSWS